MAYFRCSLGGGSGNGAVITVTYGAEFYNQTLVATNGTDTVSVLASSSGTADITVPSEGSWVISCTIGADTYTSDPVLVELSYEATITAIPDGSTVLPTDDIETWLECAGITDKAYTTLSEVLADTDTYTTLLGDSNACDYMARSTTWASTIVADADAMHLLGMYDYACDALLSDSTWASAIANSTYFESVLTTKIPVLTANSQCIASSYYTAANFETYKIFDGNTSTIGTCNQDYTTLPLYVGYDFTENVHIHKVKYVNSQYTSSATFKLQGSDDNSTWNNVSDDINITSASQTLNSIVPNSASYRYWRINYSSITSSGGGQYAPNACEVQFYGRAEAQTDIIVSAPSDTIYYMDNGSPVTLCTTDTDGIGSVDWSTLPTGDITLYSSVAKNPNDLTADYSKTIKVTKNKVEGYLMPDTIELLYWYGWESNDLEDLTSANGWSRSGFTFSAPTRATNYLDCARSSQGYSMVTKKDKVGSGTVVKAVTEGVTAYNSTYGYILTTASKSVSATEYPIQTSALTLNSQTLSSEVYACVGTDVASGSREIKVYAFWLE